MYKKFSSLLTFLLILAVQEYWAQQKIVLREIKEFPGYFRGYFSPDSRKAALLGEKQLRIVDLANNKTISNLSLPSDDDLSLTSAAFSPDGRQLALSYNIADCSKMNGSWNCKINQKISIYDVRTGKEVRALSSSKVEYVPKRLTYSSDGKFLSGALLGAEVWSVDRGNKVYKSVPAKDFHIKDSTISPDANWLATYEEASVVPTGRRLTLTNLASKEERRVDSERTLFFKFSMTPKV